MHTRPYIFSFSVVWSDGVPWDKVGSPVFQVGEGRVGDSAG